MSDITINIPSDPIRNLVKSVIKEELQPTLYGNDNTISAMINDEIANSPRIEDRIKDIAEEWMNHSRSARRAVEDAVNSVIDYSEIASNIEVSEIADRMSTSEIACEIDLGELANEISLESLAREVIDRGIDYRALAKALLREIRAEDKPTA